MCKSGGGFTSLRNTTLWTALTKTIPSLCVCGQSRKEYNMSCGLSAEHDFPAHAASYHGNLSLLIMLIEGGHCGINDQDVWGATPLHKGGWVAEA